MGTNQARCEQHYEQRYEQWAAPLRGRPGVVRALNIVNRGIVIVFYVVYALLLGWACVSDPWRLVPLVGVTAVTSPYTIQAIGDRDTLASAVSKSTQRSLYDSFAQAGIYPQVNKESSITLEAAPSGELSYAKRSE